MHEASRSESADLRGVRIAPLVRLDSSLVPSTSMNFQDSAAQKAAALIAELTATWSAKSRRELQTFHKALEAAVQAAETALTASTPLEANGSIAKLVEQLTADANAHAEATARRVQADAQARLDELRKDVEERAKNQAHLSTSLGELQAHADGLRNELHAEKSQTAAVRDDLARAREAQAVAEAERQTAEAASEEALRQRSDSNRQLQ